MRSRLSRDSGARVPFAMVAVLVLMLSAYSGAYMGGINAREASHAIHDAEVSRQRSVLHRVENAMALEGLMLASKVVLASTQFLCNESMLDTAFSENYTSYLEERFPLYEDPYHVEVRDFRAQVYLEEQEMHDLVPSNDTVEAAMELSDGDTTSEETIEVLDTDSVEEYGETTALARYVVVGSGNCTVRNLRSGDGMECRIGFERSIDSPFPLMNSKMLALESEGDNNAMGLSRAVKYILTTLAQFRVLQGYGSGLDEAPGGTLEILTAEDVALAVNLAILLESVRLFRDYDSSALYALGQQFPGSGSSSLDSLFRDYVNTGTLDPSDIIAIYQGLDTIEIPLDVILAQAFSAVEDQFVLKYLDYFGIMDIVNSVYRGIQKLGGWLEDIGRCISDFISGSDGEDRDGIQQVSDWICTQSNGLAWPPEPVNVTAAYAIPGTDPCGPTDLAVLDMLQPVEESFHYSAVCHQLADDSQEPILGADGAVIGTRHHVILETYNVSADTLASHDTPYEWGYVADFQPVSIVRAASSVDDVWQEFYDDYYSEEEDVIYDTVRDSVKNASMVMAGIITSFIASRDLTLDAFHGGAYRVDPKDNVSVLEGVRDIVTQALEEATMYIRENPGTLAAFVSSLASKQSQMVLHFMEFVSEHYDVLADSEACLASATDSLSWNLAVNASYGVSLAGTATASYSEYNELGHVMGFADDPLPYNCTEDPGTEDFARVITGQNRAAMRSDLQPYAEQAYEKLKYAEANWQYFDHPLNGLYMKALQEIVRRQESEVFARFYGPDSSSYINLADSMVVSILGQIICCDEMTNTQYCPELVHSDAFGRIPFDLHQGNSSTPASTWNETFTVTLPGGPATSVQGDPAVVAPYLPSGVLAIDVSEPDGVHYTDITSTSERPFENTWHVSVGGRVPVRVTGSSRPYLDQGLHRPAELERELEIDLCIPVVAYSGWDLEGVEYESTNTLASDLGELIDSIGDFFGWIWDALSAPVNWIIDQVMKVVDFFADIIGKLLGYASEIMDMVTQIISYLVELVQDFLREVASWVFDSIIGWIIDLLPDGLEFEFKLFGFTFGVFFASEEELESADSGDGGTLVRVETSGNIFGAGFDVGIELVSLSDDVAEAVDMDYDMLVWSSVSIFGFTLDTVVDPFMAIQDNLVEVSGSGAGWGLELVIPEVETYDSVRYSLQDIPGVGAALSNIPIPFLGVKASVDAGLDIAYTLKGLEEDHVVINEVELNPWGDVEGNQWVELYNPTNATVSLDNWTLGCRERPDANITMNGTFQIMPGGYQLLAFGEAALPVEGATLDLSGPDNLLVDSTPTISESQGETVGTTCIGSLGSRSTWQRTPNGANLTIAGEWAFTNSSIGAQNAAVDIEFRQVVWNLLKAAFNATWQELKDDLALSLDFIVQLVTRFIQRFIDDVLGVVERSVVETSLFIDVCITEMTGTAGAGIALSFVIEGGETLAEVLRWVIGTISAFLARFGKPTQPSAYPRLAPDVPEHLYVRLEFYAMVQVPGMVKSAASCESEIDPVKLAGRIEANIPALAALVGKDLGRWRINFGVYIEDLPAAIADPLFGTGDASPDIWLFKGAVFET